jgi:hypothetical protein
MIDRPSGVSVFAEAVQNSWPRVSIMVVGGVLPLVGVFLGGSKANEVQSFCDCRRSGGGYIERGDWMFEPGIGHRVW